MTLYSCLPSRGKITVIATWAGERAESHSANVSTFSDADLAAEVADELTCVSESMWDAAAWLDIYDTAESALARIVEAARAIGPVPEVELDLAGYRHEESWTGTDLTQRLSTYLPRTLNRLTRTQRLSVADELAADAAARAQSLELLPTGHDPAMPDSRIWQAADITRVTHVGLSGSLPNGAAGWLVRIFDTEHGPAERWGARDLIHRLEQLEAAARTVEGRGGANIDPFGDHLVLPYSLFGVHLDHSANETTTVSDDIDPAVAGSALASAYRDAAVVDSDFYGDAVLYITPNINEREVPPWDRDVFAKVDIVLQLRRRQMVLATIEPTDTAGFVAALGDWVTRATFRG